MAAQKPLELATDSIGHCTISESSSSDYPSGSHKDNSTDKSDERNDLKETALLSDNWGHSVINQEKPWNLPVSGQSSPIESKVWRGGAATGTEIWEHAVRKPTSQGNATSWVNPATHLGGTWGEEDDRNVWKGVPTWQDNGTQLWNSNTPQDKWSAQNWPKNEASTSSGGDNGTSFWGQSSAVSSSANATNVSNNNSNVNGAVSGNVLKNNGNREANRDHQGRDGQRDVHQGRADVNRDQGRDAFRDQMRVENHREQNRDVHRDQGREVHRDVQKENRDHRESVREVQRDHRESNRNEREERRETLRDNRDRDSRDGNSSASHNGKTVIESSIGTWCPVSHPNNKKEQIIQPTGWDEEESLPKRSSSGNSGSSGSNGAGSSSSIGGSASGSSAGNSSLDDGTALWGNPERQGKVCRWKDAKSNSANGPSPGMIRLPGDLRWDTKDKHGKSDAVHKKEDVETALRNNSMKSDETIAEMRWGEMEIEKGVMGSSLLDTGPLSSLTSINIPNRSTHTLQEQSQTHQSNIHSHYQLTPSMNQVFNLLRNNAAHNASSQASLPSEKQLFHLVRQIQLAVQTGHLNAQILNQSLAPHTIHLIYRLLQQIKLLQQLQAQARCLVAPSNPMQSALHVQITQTKQSISNIQNQINIQQALYLKSQQHPTTQSSNQIHTGESDSNELGTSDLRETLKEFGSQSRLKNWKVSSPDNDFSRAPGPKRDWYGLSEEWPENGIEKDFMIGGGISTSSIGSLNTSINSSVGSVGSSVGVGIPSTIGSNLSLNGIGVISSLGSGNLMGTSNTGPIGSMSIGGASIGSSLAGSISSCSMTYSSPMASSLGSIMSRSMMPSTGEISSQTLSGQGITSTSLGGQGLLSSNILSSGGINNSNSTGYNICDLVPEFEPGKPWKGSMKLEDDPNITAGSMRSLSGSVNSMRESLWPKGNNEIGDGRFGNNNTGNGGNNNSTHPSISSSTSLSSTLSPTMSLSSISSSSLSSSTWAFHPNRDDAWSGVRPPPGLSKGWNWERNGSGFVLLSNLTPQIDGSTLKTLCMQHGPLQLFHLFLNNGRALVRYSSKEEASKAQSALNNCVLANATIVAQIPTDSEAQQWLSLISPGWLDSDYRFSPTSPTKEGVWNTSLNLWNLNGSNNMWEV